MGVAPVTASEKMGPMANFIPARTALRAAAAAPSLVLWVSKGISTKLSVFLLKSANIAASNNVFPKKAPWPVNGRSSPTRTSLTFGV